MINFYTPQNYRSGALDKSLVQDFSPKMSVTIKIKVNTFSTGYLIPGPFEAYGLQYFSKKKFVFEKYKSIQ